jgi:transposase-like protein
MPTKTDTSKPETLTPAQSAAVDALAAGNSVTATAETIGVSRQTVSEWLNHAAVFQAELNRRRQELFTENTERLRALVPRALDILAGELEVGNLTAAVHALKAAGIYARPVVFGETDAVAIESKRRMNDLMSWTV